MRRSFAASAQILRNRADINQLHRPPQAGAPRNPREQPPPTKSHCSTAKSRVQFRIEHPDQLLYFLIFHNSLGPKEGLMGKAAKNGFNPKTFLAKVGTGKTISEYRKDQIIFAQGDVADTILYLRKGKVKIVVLSDQGKEAVVGIIEPGQFFGEGCLNGQSKRIATATAMEECLITLITKTAMTAVLQRQPKFSQMFVAHLLTRNNRVEADLIDQLFNSSEKRLARLLLLLANFGKEGRPQPIAASFDQGTLAEMIGTTRSRVSSFMNKFRKLGFISYNGSIEVHRSLLNAVLQERPRIGKDEEQN
jgi:CRP/FNR family transcriptional regulator, cyclic AMP receptor protein